MLRLAPLLACLGLACAESPTLLITIQHSTLDPTAAGNLEVQVLLAEDGKTVSQRQVSTTSLGSRQRLLEGLELVEGQSYRLRLVATFNKEVCSSEIKHRAVGESPPFVHRREDTELTVYVDCADASGATGAPLKDRMLHAAAFLPDPKPSGQVLILGGTPPGADVLLNPSAAQMLSSVESYNADSGRFGAVGAELSRPLVLTQATAVSDDEVLVTGGLEYRAGALAGSTVAEAFKAGQRLARTDLAGSRGAHATVALSPGRLAIIGGLTLLSKQAALPRLSGEIYDTSGQGDAKAVVNLKRSRVLPAAIPLDGGRRVLVAGGEGASNEDIPNELLCLSGTCDCGKPPCTSELKGFGSGLGRTGVQGAFVSCTEGGGAVYLVGGGYTNGTQRVSFDDIFCLDAGTLSSHSTLTAVGKLKRPRNGHTVTLIRGPDGGQRLFVAGGGTNPNDVSTSNAELVPVTCRCETVGPIRQIDLSGSRIWHTATLLPDGTVLLVGGFNTSGAERFNPNL
jgi:hypothetical protein